MKVLKPFNLILFKYISSGNIDSRIHVIKAIMANLYSLINQKKPYITKKDIIDSYIRLHGSKLTPDISSGLPNDLRRLGIISMLGKRKKRKKEIVFYPEWKVIFWTASYLAQIDVDALIYARKKDLNEFKYILAGFIFFKRTIFRDTIAKKLIEGSREFYIRKLASDILEYIKKVAHDKEIEQIYSKILLDFINNHKKFTKVVEKLSNGQIIIKIRGSEEFLAFSDDFMDNEIARQYFSKLYGKLISPDNYLRAMVIAFANMLKNDGRFNDVMRGRSIVGYYPISRVVKEINEVLGIQLGIPIHVEQIKSIATINPNIRIVASVMHLSEDDYYVWMDTQFFLKMARILRII